MFHAGKRMVGLANLITVFLSILNIAQGQVEWIKNQHNPVIGDYLYNGTPVVRPFVIEDGGLFRIIYTVWDENNQRSITEALSFDGVRWYQLVGSPLLKAGSLGYFDENGIAKASIIKDKNGYKMYYCAEDRIYHSIGLATSADGINWIKYPGNPILVAGHMGSWDEEGVWAPVVILDSSGNYRMFYQGINDEYSNIGFATSRNGILWEKYPGNPILYHGDLGEFDELSCGEPDVVFAAGRYHLFYTGTNTSMFSRVGYAQSLDGVKWTKYPDNPIIEAGPDFWDYHSVAAPTVVYKDSIFHMWYSGWSAGDARNIGYAISFLDTSIIMTALPAKFMLEQNYPNPFNPVTTIEYTLPVTVKVRLTIYNILGQEVVRLVDGLQDAGYKTMEFDASNLPSGMYTYQLTAGPFTDSKKMILLK